MLLTLSNLDGAKSYEVWVLGGTSSAPQTQRVAVEGAEIYSTFNQSIAAANQMWVNGSIGTNTLPISGHSPVLVPSPLHADLDDDGTPDGYVVRVGVTKLLGSTLAQLAGVAIREYTPVTSYTLPDAGGPFTLGIQNGSRVLKNSSNATLAIFDSVGAITINGTAAANDLLTVSLVGGNPLGGGVTFNGGAGGSDALTVTGGATTTVTHEFANANDGSVTLSGTVAGTISYTGLEPITDNLAAADRVFTFNGGSESITLADAVGAAMTIDSTLGESVTFANPTSSITINAGSGDDAVQIQGVDGAFAGNLTVHGDGASDTIEFLTNATLLGTGALVASAETINVSAAVTATGGVTFSADAMTLAAAVNTGASTVALKQQTNARPIAIGTEAGGNLSLTDAELDQVTAATVAIGDANSGEISITAAISPANYKTLSLQGPASFAAAGGFAADVSSATVLERLQVAGSLTIDSSASLSVQAIGGFVPAAADTFLIIENTSGGTTTGFFTGKPEGTNISIGGVDKKISYSGGVGSNDVLLSPGSRTLTWTGGDDASDFLSDPDNWDSNPANGVPDPAAPQNGDNLVIPATGNSESIVVDQSISVNSITTDGSGTFEPLVVPFAVTLTLGSAAGPYAFGAVTINGGTVAGPGTLTNAAGQTLAMQYGNIHSPLSNHGLLLVRGSSNAIQGNLTTGAGSTLRIEGDANFDSATLTVANGFTNNGLIELTSINGALQATLNVTTGTLVNAAGRAIEVLAGSGGSRYLDAQLDNQGTLAVGASVALVRAGAVHTSSGAINITAGELAISQFGAGAAFTTTGTISIGAGATLDVLGGVFNYDGGSISGDGTLQFSFGAANFTPSFTNTSTALELNNATLNGPGTITNAVGKTLLLEYSSINAPLVNEGLLKVRGGSANQIGGALTTTSTSTIRIEADGNFDNAALTVASGFTNNGLIELTSINGAMSATLTVTSGTLVNAIGKTIEIEAGTGGPRTVDALLNNQGTLQVASTLGVYGNSADHLNSGTIDVTSGDLIIYQSGITPSLTTTGTINIATGSTLEVSGGEFNYSGGSITGAGRLLLSFSTANFTPDFTNATTNLELNSATVNGPGIITNAAGKTLLLQYSNINAPLVNEGLLKVRGGSSNQVGGTFTTTSTSTIRIEADGNFDNAALTVTNGFTNNGLIELTSVNGALATTLNVTNGTLVNAAGKTIDVQVGGGGTRTLNGQLNNQGVLQIGTTLGIYGTEADHLNSGTIQISGGDLSVFQFGLTPTFSTSGAINISAGRKLEVSAGEFNYSGGSIAGAGKLLFLSAIANFTPDFSNETTGLELHYATLNGPGTVTNAAGKTLLLEYSNINAPLVNAGLLRARGNASNNLGGTLTTVAGSTIRVEADGNFDNATLTVASGFTNNGLIELTSIHGGLAATLNVASGALVNAGGKTIDVQAGDGGTRTLNVLLDNRGTLQVAAALGIYSSEADHLNSGTIEVAGGDLSIYQFGLTPSFTNSGTINISPARELAIHGGQLGNLSAGTLTDGVFNIAGTLRLNGAPISTNASTLVLDGALSRIIDHSDSNLIANLATNAAGGSLTVKGGRNLTVGGGFSNAGTVDVEALSTLATSAGGDYVQTGGVTTLLAASSTLDPAGAAMIQGGVLAGRGTVAGSVTNSGGTVEPGLSPGLISVAADYVQQADATLEIEIAGRAPAGGGAAGVTFDAVSVAGNATLAGKLDLTILGGFSPVLGDVYPIITASSRSGSFAAVVGTQINAAGLFFDTVYHASGVDLVVAGLNAGSDAAREEGQVYELLATFTDSGDENNQTAVIDWGDGSPPVPVAVNHAANTISATHVYGDNGNYTVTLSLASPDGTAASDSLVVTVANANPVIALPVGLSALEAAQVALDATFSDAGFGTPAGAAETFTYTVNWGDGSPLSIGAGQVSQVGSPGQPTVGTAGATHTYADSGVYTVTVTVTDDNGGSDSKAFSLTVQNVDPTAEVGGPYSVSEGSSVALTATGSDVAGDADPLTFHWDFDNDGEFDDATGPTPMFSAAAIDGFASPGNVRTVRVQVRDGDGGVSTASTTVTVTNVAPAANAGGPYVVSEGSSVGLTGTGTDAAPADQAVLAFAWDLDNDGDFDDATGTAPSFSAAAIDGLVAPGTVRTVRLRVSDDDGGSSTATTSVTITNAVPTANAGGPYSVAEGSSVGLVGTGTDSAPADQAILTFAWDLDNDGDFDDATGTAPSFSAAAIDGLVAPGTVRTVRLRVSDDDGGSSTATTTVTITNAVPTANAGGPYSVAEGSSVGLAGTGTDAAPADQAILAFAWDLDNDGDFDDATGPAPSFSAAAIDGLASPGTIRTVRLRVSDDDRGSSTATTTVTVTNVAPTAEANGPYSVVAGGSVVLGSAGSFDPALADGATLSYLWDFDNDGVFGELGTAFGDEVGASPTFQASGLLGGTAVSVALRVTDDDGGTSNTDSATISVNNVGVPTLTIDDVQTTEGDNGAKDLTFTVTLSEASAQAISVNYATADGLGVSAAKGLQVTRLASGLANPLFVAAAPGDNDRLFIVEQGNGGAANIRVYKRSTGSLNAAPFLTVTGISTGGERGLLGLAFSPDYAASGLFYIYVTNASGHTEVRKHQVTVDPDIANASGDLILTFTQPFSNHNGGWMGFGFDGYLYIASGDGGSSDDPGNNGQSLNTLLGKILRIDPSSDDFPADGSRDYSIPAGNPFAADGDPATLAEIWHYGLRNPWRPSFDRSTGDFYIADVGQGIREEVNVQPVGHPGGINYGWRPREGTQITPNVGGAKPDGAIDPIYEYAHGGGTNQGNSVTGGYVYRGPIAELGGSYFFGDYVNSRVWSLRYDGSDPTEHDGTNFTNFTDWTSLLSPSAGSIQSIASFGEDNQGNLLIVDYGGEIFELTNGGDYLPTSGQLTFGPGQTTQTITVRVLGDVLDEPNESFFVNLTNAVGGGAIIGDAQGSGTILDDDNLPTIRLSGPGAVTESDSFFDVFYEVSLSNPSSAAVVVNVVAADGTANGTDYQLLGPTTLTFNPGETFKRFAVRVLGDEAFERAEQFRLSLQSASNATIDPAASLIDVTIQNDDAAPTLTVIGGSTSEGNLPADNQSVGFVLLLSAISSVDVAGTLSLANGTAELGSDFENLANLSFTIPAGSLQIAVQVPVIEDLVIEANESFTLTASVTDLTTITAAGSNLAAIGTIENDDFACGLVVTTTADSGNGSLRSAILCANETAGTDTITFAIPGPGVQTIVLATALPEITEGVVIDGFSQPGSEMNFDPTGVGGDIRIALSGALAGANANGLALVAGSAGSTISGLAIHGFSGSGIFVISSDNDIHHNVIGTNAAGDTAVPNRNGIEIVGGNVGFDCDDEADCGDRNRLANNLISGNGGGSIVTVDGTDMPWLFGSGLNEGFEYGFNFPQNAGSAPTVVPVTPGSNITVSYVSGLINAFLDVDPTVDGRGYSGDLDPVPFATNDLDNFPNAYLNPDETHFLMALVGVFANSAGQIIGQPFAIRNGQFSAAVPEGATRLQLGVNDDLYVDNSGALQVRITGDFDFGAGHGVLVRGLAAENVLTNNFIGTDITGTAAIANSRNGVSLYDGANQNAIGLPGGGELPRQGNLISGNIEHGIDIAFGSSANSVQGNHIGTDRDGFSRLGNNRQGVLINQGFAESAGASDNLIGADDDGFIDDLEGNLISANGEDGIRIEGGETSGNRVAGNRIGTDVAGGFDLGNRNYGIVVIGAAGNTLGGLSPYAGNLISGNDYSGMGIFQGAAENTIVGNRIGTDSTGLMAIGNADYGVTIESSSSNVIGGDVAAARNVISGNGWVGVGIFGEGATGNRLQGNYIGVDASGNSALANDGGGVVISGAAANLIGGDSAAARNVIAGNSGDGVAIFGEDAGSNRIQGNLIGPAADGITALGNSGLGIGIFDANDTLVGGSTAAVANTIAHNGAEGVYVDGGARNTIRGNSIYANGRLGINLFSENDTDATHRVTPNDLGDSDIGANDLYNFPVLDAASINGGNLVIAGSVGVGAIVELFQAEADPSGFGEGRQFLAALVEGSAADGDPVAGRFRFSLPVPVNVSNGVRLTATATSTTGSTSEFSANVAVAIPAFSVNDVDRSEGSSGPTEFTFTVSLNNPPAEPVSVVLDTADGTATISGTSNSGGEDYVAIVGQLLTFVPGGPLSQTFTVQVNGDGTFEGDEHFFLQLSNPTGGAAILDGQGRGEIRNDDARPTVSINDRSVFETNGGFFSVFFDITLSNPSSEPLSLGVLSADGTATTADGDYTLTSVSPFTFNPGITALQTAVQINGDTRFESNESFFVNLTLLSGAAASGNDLQGIGTITNDDLAPTLSIQGNSVLEGNPGDNRVVEFTLSLSAVSGVDVAGTLAVASNGPAQVGSDFVDISGQAFLIPAGQTQVVVQVPILEDLDIEGDESFPLTATGTDASAVSNSGGIASGSGTILNDDFVAPSFTIDDVSIAETNAGTTVATFTVTLSGTVTGPVAVTVQTANNSAIVADVDYQAVAPTILNFAAAGSQTVSITINGDQKFELDETYFVNLSNPTGGAVIADGQGLGTIRNDDAQPSVSLGDFTAAEGHAGTTPFSFAVTLTNPSDQDIRIDYQTADGTAEGTDGDYVPATSFIVIPAGATAGSIAIQVNGDNITEADQDFFVNVAGAGPAATVGDGQGRGVIENDDATPLISLVVNPNDGLESVANVLAQIQLDRPSDFPVQVLLSTSDGTALAADGDYDPHSQTYVIPPRQTALPLTLTGMVNDDAKFELDESFSLGLSAPVNAAIAQGSAAYTIRNDDAQPTLSIDDVTLSEGDGGTTAFVFTVSLSNQSYLPVSANYATADGTATIADSDYASVSGLISIPAGSTTQTISVLVTGDLKFEQNDTFLVNLSVPTNASLADGQGVGTITNDDAQPTLSVDNVTLSEGDAGTTAFVFTVSLSNPSYLAVSANYATSDDTATTADGDYSSTSGLVSIAAGATTQTITVQVTGDNKLELNDTFLVNLTSPANATLADGVGQGTISNDDAQPTITINDVTLAEGNGGTTAFIFTVSLSNPSYLPVSASFATGNGTATLADLDYATTSGVVNIAAGSTTQTITVQVTGDSKFELNDTFSVDLSNAANASLGDGQGVGTISNDDAQPTIAISNVALSEGNSGTTDFVFTVSLSNPSYQAVSANYATADGTATLADNDYASSSGLVTIAAGSTTQTITVQVAGDIAVESAEQFFVNLSGASNGSLAGSQGIGTILNDDFTTPTFTIDDVTLDEGQGGTTAYVFTVSLSQAPAGSVSVTATTADGTATTADSDYSSHSQLLTFTPNQLTQTFTVVVNGDTKFEVDQDFFVNLTGASAGTLIGDSQGRGLIRNDDSRPTISINNREVLEGGVGSFFDVFFELTLSNPSDETVTVTMNTTDGTATTADGDYQAVTGRILTFTPAQVSQSTAVRIFGDAKFELDETFLVSLTSPSSATIADVQGVGTITNEDGQPTITISDVTLSEGNSGTTVFVFTVSLSNPSYQAISASFATADGTATVTDSDYVSASGLVNIAAGSTTQTITVQVTGDNKFELDDAFLVNLTSPANATLVDSQGEGTITNDDAPPTISINSVTLSEGNSGTTEFLFTVNLSNPSHRAISANYATVDGTATLADNDYASGSGLVTIAAGATTQTITVQVAGDTSVESDEQFFVSLNGAVNGSLAVSQGSGTILNDDFATPTFSIDDVSHEEGNGGTTAYVFTVSLSQAPAGSVSVTATTADGTATTADSDYSSHSQLLTFTPNQLTQTFTVVVNGDNKFEVDQDFFVNLTGASAGTLIGDGQGQGTITNDDAQPTITIGDVTLAEGNSGTTAFVFSIGLSNPSDQDIRIDFQTADGTAKSGESDYQAKTDFVILPAGATTGSLTIQALGDTTQEPDEDFFVNLNAAGPGATLGDNQARGLIVNDDAGLPPLGPAIVGDDQTAVYRERGVWTSGPTGVGYQGDIRTTPAGTGTKSATWKLPKLAAGLYEVFATWPAAATPALNDARASNATFAVFDGATLRGTGVANQRTAPNDGSYDGAAWESLGFFVINSGVLVIQLSDQANGVVMADGVLAVRDGEGEAAAASPVAGEVATDELLTPLVSLDASNDGRVTALDALMVINYINAGLTNLTGASGLGGEASIDINADQAITARDALHVINHLNAFATENLNDEVAADAIFADLGRAEGNATDNVLGELLASGIGGRRPRRR